MDGRATGLAAAALAIVAGCTDASSPGDGFLPPGTWISDQATLTVTDSSSRLVLVASGGCYGSFATVSGRLPNGVVDRPATYTQLIGAFPGAIDSPARFRGSAGIGVIDLSIEWGSPAQVLGPFTLRRGVDPAWPRCLFPTPQPTAVRPDTARFREPGALSSRAW